MNQGPQGDPLGGAQAELRAFYDYWRALPRAGLLPALADLLDNMPPEAAPYVVIVDVKGPQSTRIRFFGTQLVEAAAFDPTGIEVGDLYAGDLRARVHKLLWAASSTPAGYLSRRKIVGRSGFVNVHPSLGLPIEIPTSAVRGVVNFSLTKSSSGVVTDDRAHLVQEMTLEKWIDIGAGVPG